MKDDYLFDKNDRLSLQVINQMNNAQSHTITKNVIIAQYNLTTYQLNKLFDELNLVLRTAAPSPCYIEEVTKDLWRAHGLTTYVVERATLTLLEQSAAFKVFNYYFFYGDQLTTTAYAKQHYLTPTVFFRQTRMLKSHFGAALGDANPTVGSEFAVRQFLFQLYYRLYTGIKTPFPAQDKAANRVIAALQLGFTRPLLPTQAVKLTTFVKLWLLRQQGGHLLTAVPVSVTTAAYAALRTAVAPVMRQLLGHPLPESEFQFLFLFLITQEYVAVPAAELPGHFPRADALTRAFIAQLAQADVAVLSMPLLTQLTATLMPIFLKFTTFYTEPSTFINADEESFFAGLYPEFDQVTRAFLATLNPTATQPLSAATKANLYFSLLFALINTVPTTALRRVIHLCVDFSAGSLYSNYVIQSLQSFSHANIAVSQTLTAATDIYIADFHAETVTVPQVIWQNPPTPRDWSLLADLILQCNQAKGKGGTAHA